MPDGPERVTVSTYVPPEQRERWRADAEALDMSQSEFLRAMVQAGRRGFALDGEGRKPVEADLPGGNPRSNDLKTTVLGIISEGGYRDWDELVQALTGDVEDRLENALDELMAGNRVTYNGRHGGYTTTGDHDGE